MYCCDLALSLKFQSAETSHKGAKWQRQKHQSSYYKTLYPHHDSESVIL